MATSTPKNNILEGSLWPDPDPTGTSPCLQVDNVARMNATTVDRLVFPMNEEEVVTLLRENVHGSRQPHRITVRGTQHCMGGQAIPSSGRDVPSMVIDTKYLAHLQYDSTSQQVTVGPGCQWSQVLRYLNSFGKAPKTMQSYASFSIGGTLAVNAHGITTDTAMIEDIVSLRLVRYGDGNEVQVQTLTPSDELFSLVVGGYGLLGIVTEVTLHVTDNLPLILDSITAKILPEGHDAESEFQRIWKASREKDSGVAMKLARLNIVTLETASVYLFRKGSAVPVVAPLPLTPRTMSPTSQLLYKWALPLLTDVRMAREEASGAAMDMASTKDGVNASITQNELLYESATPLAKLYSPFAIMETTTFVLQEFFCPDAQFTQWIRRARPIFQEMHEQKLGLLNTTIRYVQRDTESFLNYATQDMFSFVLYYRVDKSQDALLGCFHNRLAQMTVGLGGTFYLPYRHCYSSDLAEQAYPQIAEFSRFKEQYDPAGLFWSSFFEDYLLQHCSSDYKGKIRQCVRTRSHELSPVQESKYPIAPEAFLEMIQERSTSRYGNDRESCCFDLLVRDAQLRREFEESFLVKIFNIENPTTIMRAIIKATWDPNIKGMAGIYRTLYDTFKESVNDDMTGKAKKIWRSLRQLSAQKKELTRETSAILHRLNRFGKIESYMSIGDHGKLVLNLHRTGAFAVENPLVYIVHDFCQDCESDETSIFERGSLHPVGHPIPYNYLIDSASERLTRIPTSSMDLVTINQGLHHIPQKKQLYDLLMEVYRVLKPGGHFVTREHNLLDSYHAESNNCYEARIEILDLAHSVFNAVTGVSPEEETKEIRAFRTVNEWKKIIRSFGFLDTMLLEMEDEDPTSDIMLCFQKRGNSTLWNDKQTLEVGIQLKVDEPPFATTFRALLSQVPSSTVSSARIAIEWVVSVSSQLIFLVEERLKEHVLGDEIAAVIDAGIGHLKSLRTTLGCGQELLQNIRIRETVDLAGLLSMPELFLILPCMKRKVIQSSKSELIIERKFLQFVESYFPTLLLEEVADPKPAITRGENVEAAPVAMDHCEMFVDIQATLQQLFQGIPGLTDPDNFLLNSGFTLTQQSAFLGVASGSYDIADLARRLSEYCDDASWKELKSILVGGNKGMIEPTVLSCGELPTKELLFSRQYNHPWHRALRVILKSHKVQLHSRTLRAMDWIGLSEVKLLYKECKKEVGSPGEVTANLTTNMLPGEILAIKRLTSQTVPSETKQIKHNFSGQTSVLRLYDVKQIVSAHYGYKSLTSQLTDITAELAQHHLQVCKALVGGDRGVMKNRVGYLSLNRETLDKMRSSSAGYRAADSVRQKMVGIGSLGMAGGITLELVYKPLRQKQHELELGLEVNAAQTACDLLKNSDLILGNIHQNDGHFTWFKLCEWMLVDILEKFGSSLDHTPWYFFPFMECIKLYFDVLFREANIVCQEYGPLKAYASQAFLTDLVPGVVMGFVFAQLEAMSAPLAALFPMQEEGVMVEEIVFHAATPSKMSRKVPLLESFRVKVDERICSVECLAEELPNANETGLFKMTLPTYKAMGQILVKLALVEPTVRILQISGLDLVQVRLTLQLSMESKDASTELERVRSHLAALEGVDFLFHYRFPCDCQSRRETGIQLDSSCNVALRVKVLSLVSLIHRVDSMDDVSIAQIYEVWNGW